MVAYLKIIGIFLIKKTTTKKFLSYFRAWKNMYATPNANFEF